MIKDSAALHHAMYSHQHLDGSLAEGDILCRKGLMRNTSFFRAKNRRVRRAALGGGER